LRLAPGEKVEVPGATVVAGHDLEETSGIEIIRDKEATGKCDPLSGERRFHTETCLAEVQVASLPCADCDPCLSKEVGPEVVRVVQQRSPIERSVSGSVLPAISSGEAMATIDCRNSESVSNCAPLEQPCTETLFEGSHLLSDGALGHAEFVGSRPKIEMTPGSLEGTEIVHRREARLSSQ